MDERRRPVISVAIANRNYGRFLPRALESVFRCPSPTRAPIQVVVADDASTDNSRALLADYRLRYPDRLEVVPIRMSAGVGAAKNAALDRCLGRTVAILDADDEFLPDKLVHCHAALEKGGLDLVTNDFFRQTQEGERVLMTAQTWPDEYWPPSTWVFRNGVVRFNPHSLAAEDPEWVERRWRSVRHRHLDLALNVQHIHRTNHTKSAESHSPAYQAAGRMRGCPYPDDQLAPGVWACRTCGDQYLLPHRCCGRATVPRPAYFYWIVRSPLCRTSAQFSLVMLTRNGLHLTRRAVSSLLDRLPATERHEIELIFVDGCSTDGTHDYIRELARTYPVKLLVTHPAEAFNYARACNRGARAAVGNYLLLLNNDIELCSDNPWEPIRAALEDPRVGVVGATTVWTRSQRDPLWRANSPPYIIVQRPFLGHFWGMRREVFWELGGVDEAFAGYGYDELDFQYCAQLRHYWLALARLEVYHEGHVTFQAMFGSGLKKLERVNRAIFARKHGRGADVVGDQVEPYASYQRAELSVVLAARNEAARLRETLARAAEEPACRSGRMQVVVLDNGSTDETALVLEEYRLRLPHCLSVITLPELVGPALARQIGRARAVGKQVQDLAAGDWLA